VHDDDAEDRVRSVLRAEGDALPLTITPDELERRLALRRRARQGRRLSLTAAAIAVIAIGSLAAASNGWLRLPGVGTPPEATASPSHSPSATTAPSPATTEGGLTCTTIESNANDQPPTILLGATPGDSIAYGGALGAYHIGNRASGEQGAWASIDPARLERVPATPPTERLVVLAGNPDACLIGLVVDAMPVGSPDATPQAVAELTTAPTRTIEFDKPPSGEWVARVHATFATRTGVTAWSETYFRVDATNPAASLGAVLGNLPGLNTPPGLVFVDQHSANLEPAGPTGLTEETVVGRVQPRGMYLVDVVCVGSSPLRWSIGHDGEVDGLVAEDRTCDGTPGERAVELGIPSSDLDVVVQGDPATAWRIRVATVLDEPAFVPPAIRMIEAGNAEGTAGGAQAYGRCVSTPSASDQCAGEWFVLEGARSILVPPGSRLTFSLDDGWTIEQARITAAVTDEVRATALPHEYSVGFVATGGGEVTIPVDLGRGSWIVRVALNASKDGQTFGAYYDLPLVIGE
jgi:hypothetical protein